MRDHDHKTLCDKYCSVCGTLQSIHRFSTDKKSSDGKSARCKKCTSAYQVLWYAKNCEKQKKKSKDWKVHNPNKNHKNGIMARYGVSEREYNGMFDDQGGCCAVCGTHQKELKRRLAVDHCHEKNNIRGLLCSNCNTALGLMRDDVKSLERAICYLRGFDRIP